MKDFLLTIAACVVLFLIPAYLIVTGIL